LQFNHKVILKIDLTILALRDLQPTAQSKQPHTQPDNLSCFPFRRGTLSTSYISRNIESVMTSNPTL